MTELLERLPFELANIVYSYVGEHPTATILKEYMDEQFEDAHEFCVECDMYLSVYMSNPDMYVKDNWEGCCEYCYAEKLGTEVYTCDDCGEKCFEYGRFNNTENGLYCGACMMGRDEDGNIVDDE